MFPVYQGFTGNALINGVPVSFQTQRDQFFGYWMNVVQNMQVVGTGDGTAGPYTLTFPIQPNTTAPNNPPFNAILRGHVDITGIIGTLSNVDPPIGDTANIATLLTQVPTTSIDPQVYITSIGSDGSNVIVQDSGIMLNGNQNYGLLIKPGNAPFGHASLGTYSTTSNTINYLTGVATVTFPVSIPSGNNINAQCRFFSTGLPRAVLFYNNTITLRSPPALQYLVELDAYLSPAAFLSTSSAVPFGYMSEYIARGAARKILSDTWDLEKFMF
jgi:hypothetical protein